MAWGNIFTATAAIATSFAAVMSFLSIRQVRQIHQNSNIFVRRHATVEFVSDPNRGISARSRAIRPIIQARKEEQFRQIEEIFSLSQLRDQLALRQALESEITTRSYISSDLLKDVAAETKPIIYRYLFIKPYEIDGDEDRLMTEFFNLLEDIANGVHSGIYDVYVLNRMYGGLILRSYHDGVHWLNWLRRHWGHRFYDQTEQLVDELIRINNFEKYQITKFKVMLFSFWRGKLLPHIGVTKHLQRDEKLLDRRKLERAIHQIGLREFGDHIQSMSAIQQLIIREIPKRDIAKLQSKVDKLVLSTLQRSEGVWPVGIATRIGLTDPDIGERIEEWRKRMEKNWECLLAAFSVDARKKETLVGIVATRRMLNDSEESKVWDRDISSAISGLGIDPENATAFYEKIGLPTIEKDGIRIDYNKIAILRSLMVDPAYRKSVSNQPIGRSLFRAGLKKIREEWGRVCLLSVLADSPVTENAIRIYRSEGGQYLGTAYDRGDPKGHLMHFFLF